MSSNPFDVNNDQQQFEVQKIRLEDSMLDSTRRAIGLLAESEEVGTKSAVELVEQGQALERISRKLDDADSTLSETQRNIASLKSPMAGFGAKLRNKFNLKRKQLNATSQDASPLQRYLNAGAGGGGDFHGSTTSLPAMQSSSDKYSSQGPPRLEGQTPKQSAISAREAEVEDNLDTMSKYLTGLKGLATNMGKEIDRQNEFIVGIKESSEKVDVKMSAQRDALQKILKK